MGRLLADWSVCEHDDATCVGCPNCQRCLVVPEFELATREDGATLLACKPCGNTVGVHWHWAPQFKAEGVNFDE